MIINGTTMPVQNGNGLPTAKFQIKQQQQQQPQHLPQALSMNNNNNNQKNNGSIINIINPNDNHNDYTQNIQIDNHNNDNNDISDNDNHYHQLHIPSGHNSSISISSQQELCVNDNLDDDVIIVDEDLQKKSSKNSTNNGIILPIMNDVKSTPSCTISINSSNNNNNNNNQSSKQQKSKKSSRKLSTESASNPNRFHQFFNPSSSSSTSPTSSESTTLAETTISSNLSLNDKHPMKKSWKLILCSWILSFLALLMLIGISFACGLLAAQYFYNNYCDLSSTLSSDTNHLVSENDNVQRTGRFNHFLLNNKNKTNVTLNLLRNTTATDTMIDRPIPTVIYSNDNDNFNHTNHQNNEMDIKLVPTTPTATTLTTTESYNYGDDEDDDKSNETTTSLPESIFDQQKLQQITTSPQPSTSESPFTTVPPSTSSSSSSTPSSLENEEKITTLSPISLTTATTTDLTPTTESSTSSSFSMTTTTTESPLTTAESSPTTTTTTTTTAQSSPTTDFFSSLIDEFNQEMNNTIKQTSHEANDVFNPIINFSTNPMTTTISDILPLELLESNKTEISLNPSDINDDDNMDVMITTTTTTIAPSLSSSSSSLVLNETTLNNNNNFNDNNESIDDLETTTTTTMEPSITTTIEPETTTTPPSAFNKSLIDPYSYLAPEWLLPAMDNYTESETVTTTSSPSTITKRTIIDNYENSSTIENIDFSSDNNNSTQIISITTNNNTNGENEKITTTITTTIPPESSRTARIVIDSNNETKLNDNNNSTLSNETNLQNIESSTQLCLDTQFKCPNSNISECFDKSRICDGIVDCLDDHFDELDCQAKNCGQNFMCGHTQPPMAATDTNETLPLNNNSLQFDTISMKTKLNAQCIPRSHYCDGIWDCHDGSDEIDCHIDKCESGKVLCRDNSACITGKQACDGVYNCRDRSDEAGCGTKSSCESNGKFYCDDSALCISKSLVCDGIADCINGADEKDCYKPEKCRAEDSKFFCLHSNECIDRSKRCDNHIDCLDYSDEDRCFESDLNDYVYAFNGQQNHWSLLCVTNVFDHDDADKLCMKMGMSFAINYTTVKISHLLNDSTWAILSPNSMKIDSFSDTCSTNLAIKLECEQLYCDSRINMKQTNIQIETPEEIPTSISIHNSTMKRINDHSAQSCTAYALSPRWLLTSGQCLTNLKFNEKNLIVNVGDKQLTVEHIRKHPKYSIFRTIRFSDHDVALIETDEPIPEQFINHSSICLPSTKLDPDITCFIGNYRNSDTAFKVLETTYCNSTEHFAGSLTDRHICAVEDIGNMAIMQSKPGQCLPPYLPLICLSSHSHWYIAGFSSYQHGCDPITGLSKFRGYSPHPTLFSNLFSMKSFIEQTLGQGTYRHKRLKLNDSNHDNQHQHGDVIEEKHSAFIVAGSVEDQQWLLEQQELEKQKNQQQQQDSRQQKSMNMNKTIENDSNDTNDKNNETSHEILPVTSIQNITETLNDTEIIENNNDSLNTTTTTTIAPEAIVDSDQTESTTSNDNDADQITTTTPISLINDDENHTLINDGGLNNVDLSLMNNSSIENHINDDDHNQNTNHNDDNKDVLLDESLNLSNIDNYIDNITKLDDIFRKSNDHSDNNNDNNDTVVNLLENHNDNKDEDIVMTTTIAPTPTTIAPTTTSEMVNISDNDNFAYDNGDDIDDKNDDDNVDVGDHHETTTTIINDYRDNNAENSTRLPSNNTVVELLEYDQM